MQFSDFESHLATTGYPTEKRRGNKGGEYLVIRNVTISGGTQDGRSCDVGILRTDGNPWVPQAALHVCPQLVTMGQAASQASELGPDWQYLSRRYGRAATPREFFTHILTVLGQL